MPKETHLRVLVRKTGGSGELVEDVTPALGRIEVRVNDGEVFNLARIGQKALVPMLVMLSCPPQ
jgi:hypothetical protein